MSLRRPIQPRLPAIAAIAEKARQRLEGEPVKAVNVAATLGHNPLVSKAFAALAATLLRDGSIDPKLRELVILRMAWNTQCQYEFGQHTLFGRAVGLTEGQIYGVTRRLGAESWSPTEAVVLQMTDDLHADDCVSEVTWAELSSVFDAAAMIELMACALCYRMGAALMNSCGVQLDEGVPGWPSPG